MCEMRGELKCHWGARFPLGEATRRKTPELRCALRCWAGKALTKSHGFGWECGLDVEFGLEANRDRNEWGKQQLSPSLSGSHHGSHDPASAGFHAGC